MALIPDLPAATTAVSTDVFVKDTGSATQKLTAENLRKSLISYVDGYYQNITIPSTKYVQLDTVANMGVPNGALIVGCFIRGWTGLPGNSGIGVALGSSLDAIYLMGAAGSVQNVRVRVVYLKF